MRDNSNMTDFLEVIGWAASNAEKSWDWAHSEIELFFAIDQGQIDKEWEEMIISAVDRQWMMIAFEMYKIMASRRLVI